MYRKKSPKGSRSLFRPLLFLSPTNVEEAESTSTSQQKASNDSAKKPFRSTLQLLNLFEKAIQEDDNENDDKVKVKDNTLKKQDASEPADEKKITSTSESKV